MSAPLLAVIALVSQADDQQLPLLKTFREEFVSIAPGKAGFPASFVMGFDQADPSEQPAHRVTLTEPFQMARHEVPQNLWQAVMGNNPSKWKGPRNSVEELTFEEAEAFCLKATRLMREAKLIAAEEVIRLPSEAEWEYAARAGTTTRYSFGDDVAQLGTYGWFNGNAAGNDPPVGARQPNAWKLYDMHGYLWEWCRDTWHADYRDAPADGSAWISGGDATQRVLRGGSWQDKAEQLTSSTRRGASKDLRDDAIGLRCVLAKESTVPRK